MPVALPIDAVLPEVIAAVRDRGVAVLVAPPGAGKTTRVPGALLDAGVIDGEVIVLQPRRLAARLAATRVAAERGGELGGEVGYEVRFDRRVGSHTRLRFVTEGVLTRRLLGDPELRGVGGVIIDEFHERNLDGDLALALVARLRARRPALRLVVMSATLDAEPVAAFLDGAPIVRSEGRVFPLSIEHMEQPDDRPLGRQVAAAVRRVAQNKLDGDVLVFLPGAAEIRRCQDDLADVAAIFDLAVLPLYGDLPVEDQDRAVGPSKQRKVILATNVAETSVTIDGVVCVIDSGLARIARHSPWTGLPSLQIEPVSRASCTQRAGRAGRTRPGRVVRLYTKHDHDTRRAFEVPELARTDLAGAALELHGAGLAGLGALRWFEPPPAPAATAAEELLVRLGAVERGPMSEARSPGLAAGLPAEPGSATVGSIREAGARGGGTPTAWPAGRGAEPTVGSITALGRRMLRFPLHPRLARIVCEAEGRGVAEPACVIAALLGARELRLERRGPRAEARLASPSDLIDDMDALYDARQHGLRADRLRRDGLDPTAASAADRIARQLTRIARDARTAPNDHDTVDRELRIAILTGFPDRVGKRRAPRSADVVFAGGGSGVLAASSAVIDAELVVCVDVADTSARGQASKVQIRRASAIEASWLLDLYLDRIAERDELVWNAAKQRVERVTQMTYDGLPIDEQRDVEGARRAGPAAAAILAREALAAGIEQFVDQDALGQWRARVALAAKLAPGSGLTAPTDEVLGAVIARACEGAISFDELRKLGLLDLLDAQLGDARALVDRLAPTHLKLPRRGRAPIHYELDQPPWIASRMQDFFGLARAPTVGDGRVPLVLHLLAPNQRPVQVTTDLPGFWVKHYPGLRKQLMRRYPKHAWPEDPTQLIQGGRDD